MDIEVKPAVLRPCFFGETLEKVSSAEAEHIIVLCYVAQTLRCNYFSLNDSQRMAVLECKEIKFGSIIVISAVMMLVKHSICVCVGN